MRKVWRDIADKNPLERDNKLVTYHSWLACPLLDLQADSHTRVRNGGLSSGCVPGNNTPPGLTVLLEARVA